MGSIIKKVAVMPKRPRSLPTRVINSAETIRTLDEDEGLLTYIPEREQANNRKWMTNPKDPRERFDATASGSGVATDASFSGGEVSESNERSPMSARPGVVAGAGCVAELMFKSVI